MFPGTVESAGSQLAACLAVQSGKTNMFVPWVAFTGFGVHANNWC